MVDKSKKTTQARARVAHKLAKYVRANPVHITTKLSISAPSVSHLCTSFDYHRLWRGTKKKVEE